MAALEENSPGRGCVESLARGCCLSSMPSGEAMSQGTLVGKSCPHGDAKVDQYEVRAQKDEKGYPWLGHLSKIARLKNTTSP